MDEDLKTYLDTKSALMTTQFAAVDTRFAAIETRFADENAYLTRKMRDMQTELLRGFEGFAAGQNIRLREAEVDQSNLDTTLSGRVNVLENRMTQIQTA